MPDDVQPDAGGRWIPPYGTMEEKARLITLAYQKLAEEIAAALIDPNNVSGYTTITLVLSEGQRRAQELEIEIQEHRYFAFYKQP